MLYMFERVFIGVIIMLIIQYYKEDISYRCYNVETWDTPIVILWQCIECRKILYECKSENVYRVA